MRKEFTTRNAADAAARRALRAIHGQRYQPKATVDFIVYRAAYGFGWKFEIVNEVGHRRAASE